MEARVDVRKLQILNDRINQTIDALNQVRLSVHGLGHTGMSPLGLGVQTPYLFGAQTPYPGPFQGLGSSLNQLSAQLGHQGIPVAGLGFQHSPFLGYPSPYPSPFAAQGFGIQGMVNPWTMGQVGGGGLFHSSPEIIDKQIAEVKASEPYRITQTFPFVIP